MIRVVAMFVIFNVRKTILYHIYTYAYHRSPYKIVAHAYIHRFITFLRQTKM